MTDPDDTMNDAYALWRVGNCWAFFLILLIPYMFVGYLNHLYQVVEGGILLGLLGIYQLESIKKELNSL